MANAMCKRDTKTFKQKNNVQTERVHFHGTRLINNKYQVSLRPPFCQGAVKIQFVHILTVLYNWPNIHFVCAYFGLLCLDCDQCGA